MYVVILIQLLLLAGPLAPYYLAAFCGSTVLALSIMGGVFAGMSQVTP